MKTHHQLTRTCSACGIEKPLAAFLQLSGQYGTMYGTICATCRSAGVKEGSKLSEEERSSTTSGITIGIKEKHEIDKEKARKIQGAKDTHTQHIKKREKILLQQTENQDLKDRGERYRRDSYLTSERFLKFQNQKKINKIDFKRSAPISIPIIRDDPRQSSEEQQVLLEVIKHTTRTTTIDFNEGAPILDPAHAMVVRENPKFKSFQAWLGNAPISQALKKYQSNLQNLSSLSSQEKKSPTANPIIQQIEKLWGHSHSSKKGR